MKKALLLTLAVLVSLTLTAQWYYSSLMAPCISVKFVNTSIGYASTGFTVARTTDGGATWAGVAGASADSIIIDMSFPTETVGYIAGLGGNLLKSTDGGLTWFSLHPGTSEDLRAVFFTSADTGYVAGDQSTLLKTTDGGATWQTLGFPGGTAFSMHFINKSLGFITDNTHSIYRTQDGGANWLEIAFPSPNKYYAVHFANATTGFAVGMVDAMTPCMIKSSDGGFKWAEVPVTTGRGLNAVHLLDDNVGYAAGFGGTIIKTTDGGATWVQQTTPDLGSFYSICFTDNNHGFAAGAALVRTDNGGGTNGIAGIEIRKPLTLSPNPAGSLVTILPDQKTTRGDLTVCDDRGNRVVQQHDATFPATLRVDGWPTGIYLVRIDSSTGSWAGKLVIE